MKTRSFASFVSVVSKTVFPRREVMSAFLSIRRFAVLAVLGIAALTAAVRPTAVRADTIYHLINFPQYQTGWNFAGGWNMSGTIVTDGNLGLLTTSDIVSWSWTTTNGTYDYSANSSQPGTSYGTSGVYATSSYLAMPLSSSTSNGYGLNLVSTIPPPAPYTLGDLNYQLSGSALGANEMCYALYWCDFAYTPVAPWWTDGISPGANEVTTPPGIPWDTGDIAFEFANGGAPTPEPSALALLGIGALSLLAYAWRKRRAA
jgi:hypothetical protein